MSMQLDEVTKLTRDLRKASTTMTASQARYLVDSYYMMQDQRIRAGNQTRALNESGEPHEVVTWLSEQSLVLENSVKSALKAYAEHNPVGQWSMSIKGVGPVISAGLLAHIDLEPWRCRQSDAKKSCRPDDPHDGCGFEKVETVGHIWRFAGLDPSVQWGKGKKRPWNAQLKTLCWKIGESFVKVSGYDDAFYGKIYVQRKEQEQARNDAGELADQAAKALETKNIGKSTEAYKHYSSGKLPPAHIHARAKRYAVKLFLSHWHEIAYREKYGTAPPLPYPIAQLGHAHMIPTQ